MHGLEEIHINTRRSEQNAIDTTATKSTGFAELLSEQVCGNVVESVTKSCFQSLNEIQKLRAWGLRTYGESTFPSLFNMKHVGK